MKKNKKFNRKSISFRIVFLMLLIIISLGILDVVSYLQSNIVDHQLTDVSEVNLPLFRSMEQLQILELEQETFLLKSVVGTLMPQQVGDDEMTTDELDILNGLISQEYTDALVHANNALKNSNTKDELEEYEMIVEHLLSLEETHNNYGIALKEFVIELSVSQNQETLALGKQFMTVDSIENKR